MYNFKIIRAQDTQYCDIAKQLKMVELKSGSEDAEQYTFDDDEQPKPKNERWWLNCSESRQ